MECPFPAHESREQMGTGRREHCFRMGADGRPGLPHQAPRGNWLQGEPLIPTSAADGAGDRIVIDG